MLRNKKTGALVPFVKEWYESGKFDLYEDFMNEDALKESDIDIDYLSKIPRDFLDKYACEVLLDKLLTDGEYKKIMRKIHG